MSSFTKSALTTLVCASLAIGVSVPAADAATVKVEGDTCVFTVTKEEQNYLKLYDIPGEVPATLAEKGLTKAEATKLETAMKGELQALDELAASGEQYYKDGAITKEKYEEGMKSINLQRKVANAFLPAISDCAAGRNSAVKPQNTTAQSVLSTEDGKLTDAGIGVVVAGVVVSIVGIIAIALPQIKNLLPPDIAAMLP